MEKVPAQALKALFTCRKDIKKPPSGGTALKCLVKMVDFFNKQLLRFETIAPGPHTFPGIV